jgi:hypothetical protein
MGARDLPSLLGCAGRLLYHCSIHRLPVLQWMANQAARLFGNGSIERDPELGDVFANTFAQSGEKPLAMSSGGKPSKIGRDFQVRLSDLPQLIPA